MIWSVEAREAGTGGGRGWRVCGGEVGLLFISVEGNNSVVMFQTVEAGGDRGGKGGGGGDGDDIRKGGNRDRD